MHEYDMLKSLRQERLVRLYNSYLSQSRLVLIMERMYGENITQFLSFKNKYTEEDVAKVIRQLLDAMQYLHQNGIAYLNIQPDNVMMMSRRRLDVRLVDFRCAQYVSADGDKMDRIGLPEFMSPEMVSYENVGMYSDTWSVGVLTFILLSGTSPFLGEDDSEMYTVTSVRYDAHELYENITKDAFKFIFQTLKDSQAQTNC